MFKIDTIIFDLDGTLVDASPDITAATNFVLQRIGWQPLSRETVAGYIGGGAEMLWRKVLGAQADSLLPEALSLFMDRYTTHPCEESYLYPGVQELLVSLRAAGIQMAIATQKAEGITTTVLKQLNIEPYFSVVVGPESVKRRKPDPESVLLILERLQASPKHALMIGDTPADIRAGQSAGVFTCAVTYGYGRPADLKAENPDFVLDHLSDLPELLSGRGVPTAKARPG